MEIIYELFGSLPRQGPGDNESTKKALSYLTDLPSNPHILDVGCGVGMQTLELARSIDGKIIALDNYQPFLDALNNKAQNLRLADKIETLNQSMLEMNFNPEYFDLIWSEGAVFIYGFEQALEDWQKFLKKNGYLVLSEACWFKEDIPDDLNEFWMAAYPAIKHINEDLEVIKSKNLTIISHFKLPESSWWEDFYKPLEKNIKKLQKKYNNDKDKLMQIDEISLEIEMFRKYSDYYGYEFFILKKP
ncbi:MAG: class I SAM-dependent methyltransferase [Candidatus Hermodarchaeota archaeon]